MTIGTVTGVPNNAFSFPRSYITRLLFPNRIFPMLVGGPDFIFNEALFPANLYFVGIDPRFWDWNSNGWTIDHVVTYAYATISPSPTPIPASVQIAYTPPTALQPPTLTIDLFIVEGHYQEVPFPQQNQPYWLPEI